MEAINADTNFFFCYKKLLAIRKLFLLFKVIQNLVHVTLTADSDIDGDILVAMTENQIARLCDENIKVEVLLKKAIDKDLRRLST